jgi:hypothetical protein
MDFDSDFLTMKPGDNDFVYNAASGVDNLNITIAFSPHYLGV